MLLTLEQNLEKKERKKKNHGFGTIFYFLVVFTLKLWVAFFSFKHKEARQIEFILWK